ncbi:MAG: hypothetical protein MUC66_06185, partial [Methanolinea sp.]|nr:hypothetical protein [Methanolinea sp.]
TKRFDLFSKTGAMFIKDRSMSVGWINNYTYHSQNSYYGYRQYDGTQNTFYSSLLYQWNPSLGNHTIDAGFSYKYDMFDETLDTDPFGRKESVPGAFLQYTYSDSTKIT